MSCDLEPLSGIQLKNWLKPMPRSLNLKQIAQARDWSRPAVSVSVGPFDAINQVSVAINVRSVLSVPRTYRCRKNKLAKALAEVLFDDESALIRFDMSEYMEKIRVAASTVPLQAMWAKKEASWPRKSATNRILSSYLMRWKKPTQTFSMSFASLRWRSLNR